MTAGVTIRALTDVRDLRTVEELQREVWGMPDRDLVPYHQLLAATATGGAVLGAFDPGGRLVGFCYGFVGLREGRMLFYSHMAGVLAAYRNQEIGYALKRAQREAALSRGLDHMVWTYDPLLSPNARFNLHKLGATARRYYVDYYGEMPDALNRGLPSDRLEVDWALRDPRVAARSAGGHEPSSSPAPLPPALSADPRADTVAPGDPVLDLQSAAVRIEIPTAFAELKARHPDRAVAWRLATRQVFRHYFAVGYRAVDFIAGDDLRASYVLSKAPAAGVAEETG
jgi:chorismate synthase